MQLELISQVKESSPQQLSFREIKIHRASRPLSSPKKVDLLEQLPDWLQIEVADGDASPHTIRSYIDSTKGFFTWCDSRQIDPLSASEDDLKLFRAYLVNHGYQRGTIATKLAGIRRFFDAVVHWGHRPDNPATKVKAKRDLTSSSDKVMEKYIDDRELFLSLWKRPYSTTVSGLRDRALLRIMCFTGIRVSEARALDLEDLDLGEKPQLHIRSGKGHKRRHVPLGQDDVIALEQWLAVRDRKAQPQCPAVFITLDNYSRGQRLGTRSIREIVNKYLREAGLKKPGRSCHALRHSLATWLLDAGVPIEAIADLLGHSSVAVTAIYAKVVDHRKYTPSEVLSGSIG